MIAKSPPLTEQQQCDAIVAVLRAWDYSAGGPTLKQIGDRIGMKKSTVQNRMRKMRGTRVDWDINRPCTWHLI